MRRMSERPLVDLKLLAYCELSANPTVTVYHFVDGVEKRRPANPYAAMAESLERFTAAIEEAGIVVAAPTEQPER